MTILRGGQLFCADGVFRALDLGIEGGKIAALGPNLTGGTVIDVTGLTVTHGLIDLHSHGARGSDASDGDEEGLRRIARHQARCGVTGFLATTMSLSEELLTGALRVFSAVADAPAPGEARLLGVNLEGPFFAQKKRGAQNPAYIIDPDTAMFDRLNATSGGRIRLADVAPELPGGLEFVRAVSRRCRVSLAHTEANYDQAIAAFDAGASHVTHLFNAMPPLHHRDPGVIGAAADRAAFAEVISDGVHLHPAVVRAAFALFGVERVCLISDSVRACGMEPGTYTLGGQEIFVTEDRATLADGSLAGSVTPLSECLRRAVSFGVPVEAAFRAATLNPARAAGVEGETGVLEPGRAADLVVWTADLRPGRVFLGGELVRGAEA